MAANAVEFSDVTKEFLLGWRGLRVRALEQVSFEVKTGTICGLLGPNGSGKSTALKALLGLIRVNGGRIDCPGIPPREIGYLTDNGGVHGHLTAREALAWRGRLMGQSREAARSEAERLMTWVGLNGVKAQRARYFSKGMRTRLGLAQVLVGEPKLLVLDEPMTGIDPMGVRDLACLLKRLRDRGVTVLLTSHLLPVVESLCDQVVLLHRGRLVAQGTVAEVRGNSASLDEAFIRRVETVAGGAA